jgi:Ni/Fe-hydrogenase 1 B-type cytochrome subunit
MTTTQVSRGQITPPAVDSELFERVLVWQVPVRLFHWCYALSIVVLFSTGLWIANPQFSVSGESYDHFMMGRVRQLHFAAAFLFTTAFMWRIVWFWIGNRYCRSGFPYVWRSGWWRNLFRQAGLYARFRTGRPHMGHNALAGLSYTIFAIGLGWMQIFTGFALYSESNPGGFWHRWFDWVHGVTGGSFQTHMYHHLFAWGFLVFVILHIYIVILDARAYRNGMVTSMVSGVKFRKKGESGGDEPRHV